MKQSKMKRKMELEIESKQFFRGLFLGVLLVGAFWIFLDALV
jgi:hypothetical protein